MKGADAELRSEPHRQPGCPTKTSRPPDPKGSFRAFFLRPNSLALAGYLRRRSIHDLARRRHRVLHAACRLSALPTVGRTAGLRPPPHRRSADRRHHRAAATHAACQADKHGASAAAGWSARLTLWHTVFLSHGGSHVAKGAAGLALTPTGAGSRRQLVESGAAEQTASDTRSVARLTKRPRPAADTSSRLGSSSRSPRPAAPPRTVEVRELIESGQLVDQPLRLGLRQCGPPSTSSSSRRSSPRPYALRAAWRSTVAGAQCPASRRGRGSGGLLRTHPAAAPDRSKPATGQRNLTDLGSRTASQPRYSERNQSTARPALSVCALVAEDGDRPPQ